MIDYKILRLIIRDILKTESYTLEGIAYYTKIPLEVVMDAASGKNRNLSVTCWMRIIKLYLQIRPDVYHLLCNKLAKVKNLRQMILDIL